MAAPSDGSTLRLFKPGDLSQLAPRRFVIGSVLTVGDSMVLHGPPKSGKSALAVAAACSVGTGRDFFGHKVNPGLVVYVCAERVRETDRRLQAALGNVEHTVRLVRASLFGERANVNGLIQGIAATEAEIGARPRLIIFDTVVSLLRDGGGDENSQRDMSRLTSAIDKIRGATGASAMVIHHSKRGEHRPKGSEVLEAWAETIASVASIYKSTEKKLEIERSNTTEPGVKARFALEPIDLGEDPDTGAKSQIVIAVPAQGAVGDKSSSTVRKLSKDVEAGYAVLIGLSPPVAIDAWTDELKKTFADKKDGARRQAISHVKTRLQTEGLILVDEGIVSVREATF